MGVKLSDAQKEGEVSFRINCEGDLETYRMESLYTKEPETVFWIEDYFSPGEVFFDVGANIGIYSLFAHSEKKVITYSFEPFLKNYVRLVENIKLNGYTDIYALPVALSDDYDIGRFFSFDTRNGASGGQIHEPISENLTRFEAEDIQDVVIFSMDKMIKDFNMPAPNHVKIDVDGNEMKILKGMEHILMETSFRSLLVEVNPLVTDLTNLKKFMADKGLEADNKYNSLESHSRHRRKSKGENAPENIIFIRD